MNRSRTNEPGIRYSQRRPRVLYLALFDPTSAATGTNARGRLFLQHLVARFDVALVHFDGEYEPRPDEALRGRLTRRHAVPWSRPGYFGFSPRFYRAARAQLRDFSPDLIVADLDKAGFYGALLSRASGIPLVYSSHNVEFRRYLDLARSQSVRYLFVPWTWWSERSAVRRAALTVTVSDADARDYERWVPASRLLSLPAAFDDTRIAPLPAPPPSGKPVILMVGNFGYAPNAEGARAVVRRVLPRVLERYPGAVFRFVGRSFPADLRHPNVSIGGFVDDLRPEYAAAHVVLAPVDAGGGVKIKLVEALAYGKPVVSTPHALGGLESSRLDLLRCGPIEEFPRLIAELVDGGKYSTEANRAFMKSRFGSNTQLRDLVARMEALADRREGDLPRGDVIRLED